MMTENPYRASPETGWPTTIMLPPPTDPMAVARELLRVSDMTDRYRHWRGDFYRYAGTHWEVISDAAIATFIYRLTESASYPSGDSVKPWSPTRKRVSDVQHALAHGIITRDERAEEDGGVGHVPMANGVLHLDGPILVSHTPAWFNLHALPFGYDPQAQAPEWHQFLEVALEGDEQRTALLQEWFGYVLVGGTDLQKMLSVFGPKRCGKGTVMRVLREMIGSRYAVAPSSLDSLGGTFGMQQLIGARLATFGDVQWTGRNLNEVVGILLGISGEDAQTIQRKNRDEWTGTLPVRFMFSGNDRPRFKNTSGALASRFLYLRFRVSMIGREDHGLTGKLLLELPGIFNWALAGWDRLGKNGGVFTDSDLGREDRREVERHASPTLAFVEDRCVIAQDAEVDMDELYEKYTKWRADEGLSYASGKPSFARDLASSVPSIVTKRVGSSRAGRKQVVFGMRLATSADQAPDQADQADQASKVDLTQEELPVQSMCGPGGPGGPGKNTDYQPENKTSYESTRSEKVQPTLGNLPGPLGPPGPGMPLSSEDSRTTMNTPAWSDKWAGIEDLIDQENY